MCVLRNVWSIQVYLHESVLERVDECGFVQAFYMHKYKKNVFFSGECFVNRASSHTACVCLFVVVERVRVGVLLLSACSIGGLPREKKDRQTASKEVNRN